METNKNNLEFKKPLSEPIKFGILSKVLPTEGNLAWEYNPFRNYRLSEPRYYFRNKFFTKKELEEEIGKPIKDSDTKWTDYYRSDSLPNGIKRGEEQEPEFYDKKQLVDFDTTELKFDINHPVDILPLYSYDGSVNLIINDGKNIPRLINSRFTPIGRNKYKILDRKGDNDTNIYDLGSLFDLDTALHKTYHSIPKLDFINVLTSGNMKVGNYHFYFKYVDADKNETDFVAESGLVSIFKGSTLDTINSGLMDENAYKSVRFVLDNIDSSYQYILVYYTRGTSNMYEPYVTKAYKIKQNYLVNNSLLCQIYINGDEEVEEIPISDINPLYQIAGNVQTLTDCQNMLFFGNIQLTNVNYSELSDLSLRFLANIDSTKTYNTVPHNYDRVVLDTYSDPKFIYNYTGYLNHEIYRFGVVYIMNDGSLSPVFNIRGKYFSNETLGYTKFAIYKYDKSTNLKERVKISFNEDTGIIYKGENNDTNSSLIVPESIENAYGVVRVHTNDSEFNHIIGIKISIDEEEKGMLLQELKKNNVKGLFFVRLKRIPLRLCQALVTGVDKESHTPLLYVDNQVSMLSTSAKGLNDNKYITERFLTDDLELTHDIEGRFYAIDSKDVDKYGAFCPEYDVNSPYLNSLFSGDLFIIQLTTIQNPLILDPIESRHFYLNSNNYTDNSSFYRCRILGIEDNVKVAAIGTKMFSSRAGEAEEVKYFEYINRKNKVEKANNLLRGIYGPYLALDGYSIPGTIVNIYINDYADMDNINLFKLRYMDKTSYYTISDRMLIDDFFERENKTLYRGDSYICTFTHRVNRNFQDPSAPINDQIVDADCWKDNFKIKDDVITSEGLSKINLGDLNAVLLGTWVTFSLVSSINLNIRTLDDSRPDEVALTGHPRGFYPYNSMCAEGPYKIPESLCYNKGMDKCLSDRWHYEVPDVPFIKNEFSNRIMYSEVAVTDAFKNGFRTFKGINYRDYPKTYGSITKLIELGGHIICVFEHGVALLPIKERTLTGEGAGGGVYINTKNVLPETLTVISDTFGSLWKDSIIKTPKGIYGVDTVAKKIWLTDGSTLKVISDFAILEFLNNNISLTERELEPIIGVRNVKTHYNKYKQDIMFTFYDNLYGFEEKVWNICYNELLNKWITFYSWVPSYSENIYNLYFSFDRNTSKWITKLGMSKTGNSFSDGVTLSNNYIDNNATVGLEIGTLHLDNRTLPYGNDITVIKSYELVRDNFKNWEKFEIRPKVSGNISITIDPKNPKLYKDSSGNIYKYLNGKLISDYLTLEVKNWGLYLKVPAVDLCSEFYERKIEGEEVISDTLHDIDRWKSEIVLKSNGSISKDERGRRVWLKHDNQINSTTPVYLLNIRCHIEVVHKDEIPTLAESYNNNLVAVDAGYYESVVAVTTNYNKQFLTTDFWRHGLAGIIDITDNIVPTYWYGKQHPFEFECIAAGDPRLHKIFDNLVLISNKTAPESFHYEIVGECYDFAKDKKNMYIRQEATKELYLYNGSDILYNSNYKKLKSKHRKIELVDPITKKITLSSKYDRSTLFPLYYSRLDTFNDIEDYYKSKTSPNKDYSNLAGAEIVRYENLDEYRIWNHVKAVNIEEPGGRLRGNIQYKDDLWQVLINPINIVYCNEPAWDAEFDPTKKITVHYKGQEDLVPIELAQTSIPEDLKDFTELLIPEDLKRGIVTWNWEENNMKEVKLKDKYIKIRVRYTGDLLALVTALKTNYTILQ